MRKAHPQSHTAAVQDGYQRMLQAAGVSGRFVTLGAGLRVHVVDTGAGEPVVHLHGNNTSSLSHLMLLEHMTMVRSYLVDRPGMGLSDAKRFPRNRLREFAVKFVGDVLDALELKDATLVGASGGGAYAVWYALEHPQRVRGLVMLGSTPLLPGGHAPFPLRLMATPALGNLISRIIPPSRRSLMSILASVGEGDTIVRHPDLLDSLVAAAADPIAASANRAELQAMMSPLGFRHAMRMQPAHLRRLAVPTMMIWGQHDLVVSVAAAQQAAHLIPRARLEILPTGHVPQLSHADRVAQLITNVGRNPQW